jgi:hypothetical protein
MARVTPFLILGLFLPATVAVGAGLCDLSGRIEADYYFQNGKVSYSENPRFEMSTDGVNYRIRIEEPGQNMATDYMEIAWDGTNGYYIEALPSFVRAQRQNGKAVGSNVATATLALTPVPQFHATAEMAGVLWCAYIAPLYLKGLSPGARIYVPFSTGMLDQGMPSGADDFLVRPAFWQYSPDHSYLEQLIYTTPAASMQRAFTNVVYNVLQSTNINGYRVPWAGQASLFVQGTPGAWKIAQFVFTLNSISLSTNGVASFQPAVPGVTLVTEERFNSATNELHFNYLIESNWPSIQRVKAMRQYSIAAQSARFISKDSHPPKLRQLPTSIKFVFLILVAAPAIYILIRRYAKGKKMKS